MDALQVYHEWVEPWPEQEQQRLLQLIAAGLSPKDSDDWTEDDLQALSDASLRQFELEEGAYGDRN